MFEIDVNKIKPNDKLYMVIPENGDNPILTSEEVKEDSSYIANGSVVLELKVESINDVQMYHKFVKRNG